MALDPDTEVVATLGSEGGTGEPRFAAITSPGDTILVPNPSYPIHQFGFIIAGASVRSMPGAAPTPLCSRRSKPRGAAFRAQAHGALIVNFPQQSHRLPGETSISTRRSSPSAASGTRSTSCPTSPTPRFTSTSWSRPASVLQVPGAKDITVEFTSLSKTYSMPGWRMGFAAGNRAADIGALARMKSYLDYGAFTPIQVAAVAALNGPQDCVTEMRALYKERRDVLIRGLAQAGWDVPSPEGSMFAWAPIPDRYKHLGSVDFAKLLLERAQVAVAPGLGFGEYGDSHVRIGLVENTHRLRQAIRNIRAFLHADGAAATNEPGQEVAQ